MRVQVPQLSVVVPTRNESDNVGPLVELLSTALDGVAFEVIFVDDSTDDTPLRLKKIAAKDRRVRVVPRPSERHNGLGPAVAEGLKLAQGSVLCVMDSDLQHPPALIGRMLAAASESDLDIVVASRYVRGGSPAGLAGPGRRLVSATSRRVAQILFREARKSSDPLSGFFLCRRSVIEGIEFRPVGFKILLEILVLAADARVGDVPLTFGSRHAGRSNASMAQGLAFARHLWSLAIQVPGSARFWKYALVGGLGLAVFLGVLAVGPALGMAPFASWAVAFALSLAVNWQLNRIFTFTDVASPFSPGRSRPVYLPVALLGGVANLVVFTYLQGRGVEVAGLGGAVAAMALNYAVHRRLLALPPRLDSASSGYHEAITERVRAAIGGDVQVIAGDADGAVLEVAFPGLEPPGEIILAAARRRPMLLAEAPSNIPQPRHDAGLSAWLEAPVIEGRRCLGIVVAHRRGRPFSADEMNAVLGILRADSRVELPNFSGLVQGDLR